MDFDGIMDYIFYIDEDEYKLKFNYREFKKEKKIFIEDDLSCTSWIEKIYALHWVNKSKETEKILLHMYLEDSEKFRKFRYYFRRAEFIAYYTKTGRSDRFYSQLNEKSLWRYWYAPQSNKYFGIHYEKRKILIIRDRSLIYYPKIEEADIDFILKQFDDDILYKRDLGNFIFLILGVRGPGFPILLGILYDKKTENMFEYEHPEISRKVFREILDNLRNKYLTDKYNNMSDDELLDYLSKIGDKVITVEDSYAVGNCKSGTESFIQRYKLPPEKITIKELLNHQDIREMIKNQDFKNVLIGVIKRTK
jgi:hypothetical protein